MTHNFADIDDLKRKVSFVTNLKNNQKDFGSIFLVGKRYHARRRG